MQKVTFPTVESAADWAKINALSIANDTTTWNDVCEFLNIERSKTKSGRVALTEYLTKHPECISAESAPVHHNQSVSNPDLAALLAASLSPYMTTPAMDESRVIELIEKHAPTTVKETRIQVNEAAPVVFEGKVHKMLERVIAIVAAIRTRGLGLWFTGCAGSGKTTLAEQAAKALGLDFYFLSVCAQTTKSDLFGYMNATGNYVRTVFRDAFEKGGIFLLDEADAGNANVLAALNSALANGNCAFPDGMIQKHENFFCIAAANTYGSGASRMYVGRNQLDAATLDRFVVTEIEIDSELELAISSNADWTKRVQKLREKMQGERIIISPRASIAGGELLNAGLGLKDVIDMVICKGCNADVQARIYSHFNIK